MAEPRGLKERHFQTPGGWAESEPLRIRAQSRLLTMGKTAAPKKPKRKPKPKTKQTNLLTFVRSQHLLDGSSILEVQVPPGPKKFNKPPATIKKTRGDPDLKDWICPQCGLKQRRQNREKHIKNQHHTTVAAFTIKYGPPVYLKKKRAAAAPAEPLPPPPAFFTPTPTQEQCDRAAANLAEAKRRLTATKRHQRAAASHARAKVRLAATRAARGESFDMNLWIECRLFRGIDSISWSYAAQANARRSAGPRRMSLDEPPLAHAGHDGSV